MRALDARQRNLTHQLRFPRYGHEDRRTGRRLPFIDSVKNGTIAMRNRLDADDRSRRAMTAVVSRELAERALVAQIVEQNFTLDDDFGGSGNFQGDRDAGNQLYGLAAQPAGDRQLISAVRDGRDGSHRHDRIGAQNDRHRKWFFGPLAPLIFQVTVRLDENPERVAIVNDVAVDADVARLSLGVFADVAREREIRPAVTLIPRRHWEPGQIDLVTDPNMLLAQAALHQHGRDKHFRPAVPFRGQLVGFYAESQSVTATRRQEIDGQANIMIAGEFEQEPWTAVAQIAQAHRADLLIERDRRFYRCKLAPVLEQL